MTRSSDVQRRGRQFLTLTFSRVAQRGQKVPPSTLSTVEQRWMGAPTAPSGRKKATPWMPGQDSVATPTDNSTQHRLHG